MIPENYFCDGQLNIWDYMSTLDTLPSLEEVIQRLGYHFEPIMYELDRGYEYEYKFKKSKLNIHESHYSDTGIRFISVGWQSKTEGFSCPCDSYEEVKKFVEEAFRKGAEVDKRTKSQN